MLPRKNSVNQSSQGPPSWEPVPQSSHSSPRPSPGFSWTGSKHLPEEDVAALFADIGPEPQELAIDPMQDGLEVLTLPGVLAIK